MAQITTPHFALPYRLNHGRSVCVEQDSIDDVACCVEAVLRTAPGDRLDEPTFGASQFLFSQRPLNLDDVTNRVEYWEPRARILLEENPDSLQAALARVRATVTLEE